MNQIELEKLKGLLEKKPTIFIGTGVSKAISGSNYVDWAGWLNEGLRIIENRIDENEFTGIKLLIAENNSESLIKAAEELKTKTKALGIYNDWMRDTIGSLRCNDKRLVYSIKDLINLGCRVVTTNFDCLIEEALDFESLLLSNKEGMVKFNNREINKAIVHFHGVYSRNSGEYEIVATYSEYLNIADDDEKQFFQKLVLAGPVLFLGCGNTRNDPNIGNILKWLNKLGFNDYHFLFKNTANNEGDHNTIIYGPEFDDLPGFLEQAVVSFFDFGNCFERAERKVRLNNLADSIYKYAYDSRSAPFKGRDKEFARLRHFIDHKTSTWWAVTGKASTGKSRLAMEYMLSRQMSDTIGLYLIEIKDAIPKIDRFFEKWSAPKLLIVIDYILGREEMIGEFIIGLSDKYHTGQLKLLLLEREPAYRDYGWFYNLSRNQLPDFARKLSNYMYKEQSELDRDLKSGINTLELAPLDDVSLERIAEELKKTSRVSAGTLVEQLKRVDPELCRPLYLQLLADCVVSDNCIEASGIQILQSLLNKYYERIKKRAYESSGEPEHLIDNSIDLIAYACAVNGLNPDELAASKYLDTLWKSIKDSISSQYKGVIEKADAVNGYLTFLNELFQPKNSNFPALQPDIIAEFFVLYFMDDDQKIADFLKVCWAIKPDEYVGFIIRFCQDYAGIMGEQVFKYLAFPSEDMDISIIGYWILLCFSAVKYFEKQIGEKLLKQVENKIEKLKTIEEYWIEIRLAYAQGLVNLISDYGTAQELGKASELLDKLEAIKDENGEIKLCYAMGLVNMITDYGTARKLGKASEYLDKLEAIKDESGEIKLAYTQGLFNLINAYGTTQELGKADELLDKLEAIKDESGEIKLRYAQGLYNLITYYGTAQELGKTGELIDKLEAIKDESGEIKLWYAKGLYNMINYYGTTQELGKAGELLDKLEAIKDESGETKLVYAMGLYNLITDYGTAQELGKASELLDKLEAIKDESGETKLRYAQGLYNLITDYGTAQELGKAGELLDKLEAIKDESGEIKLWYAQGLYNLITDYGTARKLGKASEYLDKLEAIKDESGEIKLAYTQGLYNLINYYGTAQELGKAGELLDKLEAIKDESGEIKLEYAQGLVNMINYYGTAQELGKAGELLDKLEAIKDESGEIKLRYAMGLYNLITYYGTAQELGKAGELLDKLEAIKDESGEIKLEYAKGLYNMITDYGTAQELGKAGELFEKLEAIKDESGEIKLVYAQGLYNMITDYGTAQELGKAGELLEKLEVIKDESGEIKLRYAKGLFNMITDYRTAQELGKADELLDKLEAIKDESGEIKLEYAKGLFNMINYHGTAQELGKAGELLEKLEAIKDECGEIKLVYAMGLVSLNNDYKRIGRLDEVEKLQEKLKTISEEIEEEKDN
jgi:uncharacterized protein YcbK (DUF882 family)